MLLGRLRIRGKLALLVLVPLLATISLTVFNAVELVGKASRAQQTATAVRVARLTGELIRELQLERLLSVGRLRHNVDRSRLALQNATVLEKEANLRNLGENLPPAIATALGNLRNLNPVRAAALSGTATTTTIFAGYATAITGLLDANHLLDAVDGNTPQGREVIALDATMRVNEGFAGLLTAMAIVSSPTELMPYAPTVAMILPAAIRFNAYATNEQKDLFAISIAAVDARLGSAVLVSVVTNPNALATIKVLPSFPALYSLTGIGRFVETKVINDALAAADSSATQQTTRAVAFGAVSAATILIVVLLGVAIGRSVAGPLRRLTQSADRVARLAESELVRVADDDAPSTEPARLRPIDIAGRDELGDLARAFGRVQETAARLVERQVAGRRNVAQMFGHVGRRTQNLVGRQIALIDKLENEETEPGRLRDLYRLDHVSSRLRRSASSLVVLSGVTGADEHMSPVALGDVVRLALAEIEDYSRVDVDVSTSVRVAPALINDLVLLLAELMENAASFSPPHTRVTVSAVTTGEAARLTIVDHGLGMSAERLAEENSRLTRRERLDLAPTEVLGLFVVGRLSRRHGLRVTLRPTNDGGVTVMVEVPTRLLSAFGPSYPSMPSRPPRPAVNPATEAGGAGPDAAVDSPVGISLSVEVTPFAPVSPAMSPAGLVQRRGSASSLAAGERSRARLTVSHSDPQVFDVPVLARATRSLDDVEPWNAFVTSPAASPSLPVTPAPSPVPVGSALSALRRRVPGATLESVTTEIPRQRPPTQQADAVQARDSLADFEAGVARAMAEFDQSQTSQHVSEARTDGTDEEGSP